MVVMGFWAFILCTGHRWRKTKEQPSWINIKQIFPEQKTKKSFALRHLCPVHEVLSGIGNPLISGQIVTLFGQGKCTFDCQSGTFKNYSSERRAVLSYFWCGVAVIFISKYGIAVFRVQAVWGKFKFYVAVVGEKIVVSRLSASFSWQEDTKGLPPLHGYLFLIHVHK